MISPRPFRLPAVAAKRQPHPQPPARAHHRIGLQQTSCLTTDVRLEAIHRRIFSNLKKNRLIEAVLITNRHVDLSEIGLYTEVQFVPSILPDLTGVLFTPGLGMTPENATVTLGNMRIFRGRPALIQLPWIGNPPLAAIWEGIAAEDIRLLVHHNAVALAAAHPAPVNSTPQAANAHRLVHALVTAVNKGRAHSIDHAPCGAIRVKLG